MAKDPIRLLPWGMAAARRLCTASAPPTATAAAAAAKETVKTNCKSLYHQSSVRSSDPGPSVALTTKEWIITTEIELMNTVKELRKEKSYKLALELMDLMESRVLKMSASKYAVRLDLIARVKGIDFAESYFLSLPESVKNLQTYGVLLNYYCCECMVNEAIALFDKMKELNLASGSQFNNLMTLYLKLGQPDKVQELFQEMKANNTPPDSLTYGIITSIYASLYDSDSVEKIIQGMRARGVTVDWPTYAQSTTYFALKKAEEIMDRRNMNPYHFLISLYADVANLAQLNCVWNSFKAIFMEAINKSYYVMLMALNKLDDIDALKKCFEEWESGGGSYDIRLVNVMIGAYLRKDMLNLAESLCRKATEKGVGSHIQTLELFIDYFVKRHKMDLALESFELATSLVKQSPWKPNRKKLRAFLKYFQEVKDVDGAEAFCKCLKKLNCLNEEAYESLLRTYVAAGKRDPLFYKRIKEDGIKLSSECEKLVETVCTTYSL